LLGPLGWCGWLDYAPVIELRTSSAEMSRPVFARHAQTKWPHRPPNSFRSTYAFWQMSELVPMGLQLRSENSCLKSSYDRAIRSVRPGGTAVSIPRRGRAL